MGEGEGERELQSLGPGVRASGQEREREKDMRRSMHDYLVINVCEPMTMSTSSTFSMILSMSGS